MDAAETEAVTCRKVITPRLQAAGWDSKPHQLQEQSTITPGRILFTKDGTKRGKRRRVDYLLRYRPDVPIAVVRGIKCRSDVRSRAKQQFSQRVKAGGA